MFGIVKCVELNVYKTLSSTTKHEIHTIKVSVLCQVHDASKDTSLYKMRVTKKIKLYLYFCFDSSKFLWLAVAIEANLT